MNKWDEVISNSLKEEAEQGRSYKFKGQIVRHFKGDKYIVLGFARNTEKKQEMVIYKALYGECQLWVRPYKLFNSRVPEGRENPTGQKYRFELYEVKSVKEDE